MSHMLVKPQGGDAFQTDATILVADRTVLEPHFFPSMAHF